jgi:hypothetical protein
VSHYAKWATAAAAVAFTALGAHQHANSNATFAQLFQYCAANNAACTLGSDGQYRNAVPEQLYQRSLRLDRRARNWLLAGQLSLVATAALFLDDLRHRAGGPDNIPYHPLRLAVEPAGTGARLAFVVAF